MNFQKIFKIKNIHLISVIGIIGIYIIAAIAYIESDTAYINFYGEQLEIGKCFYREHYHIECPSCGLTRSFIAIESFNFMDAVRYNKLGVLVYILSFLLLVFNILSLLELKFTYRFGVILSLYGIAVAVFLVVFWFVKIFTIGIFV